MTVEEVLDDIANQEEGHFRVKRNKEIVGTVRLSYFECIQCNNADVFVGFVLLKG